MTETIWTLLVTTSPRVRTTLATMTALSFAGIVACSGEEVEERIRLTSYVDPLIGSGGLGYTVGSIPPGPTVPFGMAKPGPDTSTNGGAPNFSHCAGYWYEDTELRGFSQIHLSGTGVPDYGVLMLMPVIALPSEGVIDEDVYGSKLEHRLETASVGYYKVSLVPSAIDVELASTEHTSLYRLTFPEGKDASVVLNLAHGLNGRTTDSELTIDTTHHEVSGFLEHVGELGAPDVFRLYFVMRFDQTPTSVETFSGRDRTKGSTSARGADIGAVLAFGSALDGPVNIQIGLSFIDIDTAKQNLDAEWMSFDLDGARERSLTAWDSLLGAIEVEGGTDDYRERFYTALFHAHHMPTLFTEAGGRYRGVDGEVHQVDGFTYYSDFSLWDTFRTLHPLMTLLHPDIQRDFVRSLLAMTEATGRIPKWPLATNETDTMISYHGETVIVDSYVKGVRDFDVGGAYNFLKAAAMGEASSRERDCLASYVERGYCAADLEGGSTSKTMENAFADFALAQFAGALGHTEDAAILNQRSGNWRSVINSATGLAQGRNADGTFQTEFREELFSDEFVEGNSRQWTVYVPHDVRGLAEHLGGTSALVAYLERFFGGAVNAEKTVLPDLWYWHGNEPDIHAAYMFAELGRADLTQQYVQWIIDHRYNNTPGGLDGNDDGGTLSAWYVFSALGFYPKVAEPRYVLGKPLFAKATIHLAEGKTFTVRANGLSTAAIYVKSVSLNGTRLIEPFIDHAAIVGGGELVFEMTQTPTRDAF